MVKGLGLSLALASQRDGIFVALRKPNDKTSKGQKTMSQPTASEAVSTAEPSQRAIAGQGVLPWLAIH